MSAGRASAEGIKSAIASGNATSSTASALQELLSAEPTTISSRRGNPVKQDSKDSATRKITRRGAPGRDIQVHEDTATALSQKAKHALATEIVNIALDVLKKLASSAARDIRAPDGADLPHDHIKAILETKCPSANEHRHALQSRSGNTIAARVLSKPGAVASKRENDGTRMEPGQAELAATCARIAVHYLRSLPGSGSNDQSSQQLDFGILALVSRLDALGLHAMVAQELEIFKSAIESKFPLRQAERLRSPAAVSKRKPCPKKSSAHLLSLSIDFVRYPEALQVAIPFQLQVLRFIISSDNRLELVEEAVKCLRHDTCSSPLRLILRYQDIGGDALKSTKHLQSLLKCVTGLCSDLITSGNENISQPHETPSPLATFELQCLILEIRFEIQRIENDANGMEERRLENLHSFTRCLTIAVRRINADQISSLYSLADAGIRRVGYGPETSSVGETTLHTLHHLLHTLAEKSLQSDEALSYAKLALADCEVLGGNDARRVAAEITLLSCIISRSGLSETSEQRLIELTQTLTANITGSSRDYEALISELSRLMQRIDHGSEGEISIDIKRKFARASATFAVRFARSYPAREAKNVCAIFQAAVLSSKTTEDLVAWDTRNASIVMIRSGILKPVASLRESQSLARAWSSSKSAIVLSRMIKATVIQLASASSHHKPISLLNDQDSTKDERCVLLEWQLKCALDICHRARYQASLQQFVPDVFRVLAEEFPRSEYPIRRARMYLNAMRAQTCCPQLLPSDLDNVLPDPFPINKHSLGRDQHLSAYIDELEASYTMTHAFLNGPPTIDQVRPSLSRWQILLECNVDAQAITNSIEDPSTLILQLNALDDFFAAVGCDSARIIVCAINLKVSRHLECESAVRVDALQRIATAYLSLGYLEKARIFLDEAFNILPRVSPEITFQLETLKHHLCRAQLALQADELEACHASLKMAWTSRQDVQHKKLASIESRSFKLSHGAAWLIQAELQFVQSSQHGAIDSAKRAVKVLNSIWACFGDAAAQQEPTSPDESNIGAVAAKVRKLNLKQNANSASLKLKRNHNGATKWPVVPLLCRALLHLCNVYTHYGIFQEALYYSEQAMKIASAVGDGELLARVRYHQIPLLAAAGRLEDAHLCLANEQKEWHTLSLIRTSQLRAQASLCERDGRIEEAIAFLVDAEQSVRMLQTTVYLDSLEDLNNIDEQVSSTEMSAMPREVAIARPESKKNSRSKSRVTKQCTHSEPANTTVNATSATPYMLGRLLASIAIDKYLICLKNRNRLHDAMPSFDTVYSVVRNASKCRQAEYLALLHAASVNLATSITYSILPESTLSVPGLLPLNFVSLASSAPKSKAIAASGPARKLGQARNSKVEQSDQPLLPIAVHAACNAAPSEAGLALESTAESHAESSLLSNMAMLISATASTKACAPLSARTASKIEYPRINASIKHALIAQSDQDAGERSDILTWPQIPLASSYSQEFSDDFQERYVDILPDSWTVLSLSLNENCEELFVTRCRRGQAPLVLKLPFARHKPDGEDNEPFDFFMGKEELRDIIELSNYSCHNAGDASVKGTKTKWWKEREALDRRLHGLLCDIERLWLGGFKGVLSQHRSQVDCLDRFRKAFEATLERHLPSRNASKRRPSRLRTDNQVLELFTSLGDLNQTELDECLADLLYFVVDMLQFGGEQNAYDEIDFDAMAVELTDALHAYSDDMQKATGTSELPGHLILVLDRRLHAFPWENLPCLEGASVSRVDSMLTLRERIIEMRSLKAAKYLEGLCFDEDTHHVSRQSVAYILNPSQDLKSTEASLGPHLARLGRLDNAGKASIIGRSPSEEEFVSILSGSSMMLYFGHGAGSQYIRPRAIRRLQKCSEVVWLMGCSSGTAVEHGELEPFSVPLAYLVAGQHGAEQADTQQSEVAHAVRPAEARRKCMAVVATLWDVTDKDIDRFSLAVGEEWGLWTCPDQGMKSPQQVIRTRNTVAKPMTPQQSMREPKTPKVRATPAAPRTPTRTVGRAWSAIGGKQSLVEAVSRSRDACYLRYLNGAAPVVYGVPVYLGD